MHHVKAWLMTKKAIRERERRRERWAMIKDYLRTHPCKDCGEKDPNVLDFHHVRGIKCFAIARAISAGYAEDTIMEEIEKCEILCANCHRRHTAKSQGWLRVAFK